MQPLEGASGLLSDLHPAILSNSTVPQHFFPIRNQLTQSLSNCAYSSMLCFSGAAGYTAHHCPLRFLMVLLHLVHICKLHRYTEDSSEFCQRDKVTQILPGGTINPPVFHVKLSLTLRLTAANSTHETSFF